MKRVNQTGSIGVFVIVGAILVAISLAVLYGIRQNNLSQDGSPISSDLVASENSNKNSQNNTSQQSADQKTNSQSGGRGEVRTDVKTEESKKTTPTPESSQSQQSPSSTTPAPSTPSKQSDKGLPKTGPEDVAVSAVAFGILAFLTVAYQRSRYLI
jgi:archaellum component FlaD/FlaE